MHAWGKSLFLRTFGGKFALAQLDKVLNDERRQVAIHDLRLIVKHLVGIGKQDSGRALLHNLKAGWSGCGRRVCGAMEVQGREDLVREISCMSISGGGMRLREIESHCTVHSSERTSTRHCEEARAAREEADGRANACEQRCGCEIAAPEADLRRHGIAPGRHAVFLSSRCTHLSPDCKVYIA